MSQEKSHPFIYQRPAAHDQPVKGDLCGVSETCQGTHTALIFLTWLSALLRTLAWAHCSGSFSSWVTHRESLRTKSVHYSLGCSLNRVCSGPRGGLDWIYLQCNTSKRECIISTITSAHAQMTRAQHKHIYAPHTHTHTPLPILTMNSLTVFLAARAKIWIILALSLFCSLTTMNAKHYLC